MYVCVFCECGCSPRTLTGSRQSESTMNPGIPPRLDSERSPVKAGELEGRGSDKRREGQRRREDLLEL